jgi:hypothetical protein
MAPGRGPNDRVGRCRNQIASSRASSSAKTSESDSSLPMSKTFRAWKIDEPLFLPPMVGDFVAKDHLACFVLSLVRDDFGLGEITGTCGSQKFRTVPGGNENGPQAAKPTDKH